MSEQTINITTQANEEERAKFTKWMNLALAALLVALLFGIGGTICAVAEVQKHQGNSEYFDAKLIWNANGGSIPVEDDGNSRIVPTSERTVSLAAQNVGNMPMYSRVKFTTKWVACVKSADGTTFTKVKDINSADAATTSNGAIFKSELITIEPDSAGSSALWENGEDGYYYYSPNDAVAAGATTGNLSAEVVVSGEVGESYNNNLHHETSAEENVYVEYAANGEVAATYNAGVQVSAELEAVSQPFDALTPSSIAKTGDPLSIVTLALFALALFAMLVCIYAYIRGKREKQSQEAIYELPVQEGGM